VAEVTAAGLRLVGDGQVVPLVGGRARRYVNLDYAASTPALEEVAAAVAALLPWYSSVHRGAGFKSQVSTALYEAAREAIRAFLRVRQADTVLFTRNTTDSVNLLSESLPEGTAVITFAVEHHANLLPWRRGRVEHLPVPSGPDQLLDSLEGALRARGSGPTLVAVTGASNVTGEIWPLAGIAALAHRYGARVFVDAAQLAPHAPIDMAALDVDYLAASGHKLYAPFGAGVLAGRGDWLSAGPPYLRGGGAVRFVTLADVEWAPLPDREEAGSPNVAGAVAMGVACDVLDRTGMPLLAAEERELHTYGRSRLAGIDGLELYTTWDAALPHIGLLTFNLRGYHHSELAAILSAEHGIGVRHGCFCAHPLLLHLLRVGDAQAGELRDAIRRGEHPALPGAVRISLGLGTRRADLDAAADALETIAAEGPRWRYRVSPATGEYEPDPDDRAWPTLPLARLRTHRRLAGESS
jgi:selenocysteine lyase/cysteine desulfurase